MREYIGTFIHSSKIHRDIVVKEKKGKVPIFVELSSVCMCKGSEYKDNPEDPEKDVKPVKSEENQE